MKIIFLALSFCSLLTNPLFSQKAVSEFENEFLPFLEAAKKQTLELASIIPEEKYSFLPAAGGRIVEQELLHLAYEPYYLIKTFLEGQKMDYNPYENKKGLSKKAIINLLTDSFDLMKKSLQEISEEQLKQTVNAYGMKLTRKQLFYYIVDHNTSHNGKLQLIVRMIGINPPGYKFLYK